MFHGGPRVTWIEDREVTPLAGAEVEFVGVTYVVEEVSWWFGGPEDALTGSDVLVRIREREAEAAAVAPARHWWGAGSDQSERASA